MMHTFPQDLPRLSSCGRWPTSRAPLGRPGGRFASRAVRCYTSSVPPTARRSRRSRLVISIGIGVVAFIGIGSVAAGTNVTFDPSPVGAVAAAADVAPAQVANPPARPTAPATAPTSATRPPGAAAATVVPTVVVAEPAASAPPLSGLTGYRWPLMKPRLTLPFGPTPWGSRIVDGARFHDGIDLATVCGDRIVAAHDGIVLAAGRHYDDAMGWLGDLTPYYDRLDAKKLWSTLPIVVVIDDGNGYRSLYAHFGKIVVKKGQMVTAGSLLGDEGRTGRASGCHLHYGLFSPDETAAFALDPAVVKRMKVPSAEIARVDPLLVLPERAGMNPTANPSPMPSPMPSTGSSSPTPAP